MTDIAASIPPMPSVPMVDKNGIVTQAWFYFFQRLLARTGGSAGVVGAPGGVDGNLQYNAAGAFGGLTDVQVTARIQPFTGSLPGSAPASGGGAANFLRADAQWAAPLAAGPAGGDLSGGYPDPTVAKISGAPLGTTTPTAGSVLVADGSKWVSEPISGDVSINSGGTVAVGKIGGAPLGAVTPTAGNLLIGSGIAWASQAVSGDVALSAAGAATVSAVNGVAYPASPSAGTVPVVTAPGVVTYETTTGSGDVVLATNPTLSGVTIDGAISATSQTSGPGSGAGTLTNAPATGNPTFWVPISVNGTLRHFPAW